MTNPYPYSPSYRRLNQPLSTSSYASVAAGAGSQSSPARFGALSHLLHPEDDPPTRNNMSSTKQQDPWHATSYLSTKMPDQDTPPSPPLFIRPSYLRNSRHVERLETHHNLEVADFDESRRHSLPNSSPQDLSANIGSATVHRSRKNIIQDYLARNPQRNSGPKKLPTCWSDIDKWPGLELSAGGTEVKFTGSTKTSDEAASIRSDHSMPREVGIYYFEVTVLSRGKEGLIGIGFSGPKASLNRLPGWEPESWAYHGDDGFSFSCTASGKPYGPKFAAWDVVGCGVNFETGSAFFTKNGVFLGEAFHNVRGDKLYPSVGMKKNNEHLRVNFGSDPFVYDIDSMMERQRDRVKEDINKTSVNTLDTAHDETLLIQELIAQYLAHDGYVETARAFNKEVRDERKPLHLDGDTVSLFDPSQDIHAINRQKIRAAILEGDIDKALKCTTTYYPHVLERDENRDIYFKLRCRKFIEMMCRVNDLQTTDPTPIAPKAVGKLPQKMTESNGASFDQQMELDDQLHRESHAPIIPPMPVPSPFNPEIRFGDLSKDDRMDEAPDSFRPSHSTNSESLLFDALEFGQELKEEFSSDPRPAVRKALDDTFALIAYQDARESIVGGLMEVSLGKPSSAALEKVVAQAEVLVDMLSTDGGAGAFVNVRKDCLQ
ncbi:SPRY-domain-containing protein [Aureobasidium pullulans]|uniref:SPRY-domain-containing protein n=1 Tax=Aureobasidium pullulans TaxID=5580 RepID=A0A4S8ZTN6_AURPU|nr:SPRY-domain-containing protein [Aureobasidium pullulans]